jgi:antiphage defense system Thoeris ThsB-like protein
MTKARHAFYSLHYDADRSRVAGILGSSVLQGNLEAKLPEWDKIKRSGDFAIKRWVENGLKGRSCCVVLIGAETASRPWVRYEIRRAHELDIALFGVHVHHLNDAKGKQSAKGDNPFEHPDSGLGEAGASVLVFDPPETESKLAYRHIVDNLAQWAEQAVAQK